MSSSLTVEDPPITSPVEPALSPFAKVAEKPQDYVLVLTLVCYLVGFYITSAYFQGLEIVNLELVRAKYILTGITYIFFAGFSSVLAYRLSKALVACWQMSYASIRGLIGEVLWQALLMYLFLSWFSDLSKTGRYWLNMIQSPIRDIKAQEALMGIGQNPLVLSYGYFAIMVAVVALIFAFLRYLKVRRGENEKMPVDSLRKMMTAPTNHEDSSLKVSTDMLKFLLLMMIPIVLALAAFEEFTDSDSFPVEFFLQPWVKSILYTEIKFYAFAVLILLPFSFFKLRFPTTASRVTQHAVVLFVFVYFVGGVTLYIRDVYPYLPQQFGGGRLIEVESLVLKGETPKILSNQGEKIFLIDRTSSRYSIVRINDIRKTQRIIEVSASEVQSIHYYRTHRASVAEEP